MKNKTKSGGATAGEIPVHCAHHAIVRCEDLKPYPGNPNKHPAAQLDLLERVIKGQGWRNTITVSKLTNRITKGHARLEVGRRLGGFVPVDYQDYADEAQEAADVLADNKISELGEVRADQVAEMLKGMAEPYQELSGWNKEARKLMAGWQTEVNRVTGAEETSVGIIQTIYVTWPKDEERKMNVVKILNKNLKGIPHITVR